MVKCPCRQHLVIKSLKKVIRNVMDASLIVANDEWKVSSDDLCFPSDGYWSQFEGKPKYCRIEMPGKDKLVIPA